MRHRKLIIIASTLIFLVVATGVAVFITGRPSDAGAQPGNIQVISSTSNRQSGYDTLIKQSQLIALGTLKTIDITFNMARDPLDISKPHPELYMIGRVYMLEVKETLKTEKGYGAKENKQICLVNREGVVGIRSEKSIDALEKARMQDDVILPGAGAAYLAFLGWYADLRKFGEVANQITQDCFTGRGTAWLFDASDPQSIRVVQPNKPKSAVLPTFSLDEIKKLVEQQGKMKDPPYPAPGNNKAGLDGESYP